MPPILKSILAIYNESPLANPVGNEIVPLYNPADPTKAYGMLLSNAPLSAAVTAALALKQGLVFYTVGKDDENALYNTDDYASDDLCFQDAVDDCSAAGGGYVYIKGADYTAEAPIQLKSNVHIITDGFSSTSVSASFSASGARGVFNVTNQNNLSISGLKINVSSGRAICTFGHNDLTIEYCAFTGTTSNTDGYIHFEGNLGSAPMIGTKIRYNRIYDGPNITRSVHMYSRNGNYIEDTEIYGNLFESVNGPCVFMDCYDYIINTKIHHNIFKNILGVQTANLAACAVHTRISASGAYFIVDTDFHHNYYKNTITRTDHTGQSQGVIYIYESKRTKIHDNHCEGAWFDDNTVTGPCIATGRTTYPDIDIQIYGNSAEGFDAAWDHDATEIADVHDNTVKNCGAGFILGYGTQKYVKIHDNIEINSRYTSPYYGFIQLGNAIHVKCGIYDNTYVDDSAVPGTAYAVNCTGHSTYDHTDIDIHGNRFYLPNGTFTEIVHKEYSDSTLPQRFYDNEIHDSSGKTRLYKKLLGNKSGALTIDAGEGTYTTFTATNNVTLTLTDGYYDGHRQTIVMTQDVTGGRTLSKPSNAEITGGAFSPTSTASSKSRWDLEWIDGKWQECSRALNLS